jgi:hypothetical protein
VTFSWLELAARFIIDPPSKDIDAAASALPFRVDCAPNSIIVMVKIWPTKKLDVPNTTDEAEDQKTFEACALFVRITAEYAEVVRVDFAMKIHIDDVIFLPSSTRIPEAAMVIVPPVQYTPGDNVLPDSSGIAKVVVHVEVEAME